MKLVLSLLGLVALVNGKALDLFVPKSDSYYGYLTKVGIPSADGEENLKESYETRVNNGVVAATGQFPWQALLFMQYQNSRPFGGGSLVSPTRILTAAHNWNDGKNTATQMTVHLGTNTLSGGLVQVTSNVIMHENYYNPSVLNDIAIVILSNSVSYTNLIQPVALPWNEMNNDFAGESVTASGFGTSENGLNGVLNFVNLKVITNQECVSGLGSYVQPTNICTSGSGNVGICSGDSGGPLVIYKNNQAILIGITSFGSGPCGGSLPSAYVRVTAYRNWIESRM